MKKRPDVSDVEFDVYAERYSEMHANNITASGEMPEFFAEYKVKDLQNLLAEFNIPRTARFLDYGAGTGSAIPFYLKYFPYFSITCIDVSEKSLAIGRDKFKDRANFIAFNGATIPTRDESFDIVYAACVLHHIPHNLHKNVINEFFRVLNPGGILMIYEHNPYNPVTVRAVKNCPFDEKAILIKVRDLKRTILRSRFRKSLHRYRVFFPAFLKQIRPLEKYLTWLPIGAQYYVIAKKEIEIENE